MSRPSCSPTPRVNMPELHEPYVRDAREYVSLAEQANGPIPKPVEPAYVWGDALAELDRVAPDARIINLETSIHNVVQSSSWIFVETTQDQHSNTRRQPSGQTIPQDVLSRSRRCVLFKLEFARRKTWIGFVH